MRNSWNNNYQKKQNMNKTLHTTLNVIAYIIVFFLIQAFVGVAFGVVSLWHDGQSWSAIWPSLFKGGLHMSTKLTAAYMALSSLLTLLLFARKRWSPVSRVWLASHPWTTLAWVVMLALGTILPSEWTVEKFQLTMPEAATQLFESIMREPLGYLAIGILGPVAEEMVFRGAVLRSLLKLFPAKAHWWPILISAVLFGVVHGNMAQFVHALPIGLLLGWMYYRTGSIIPGLLFHWVNNTMAYVMFNLMPQMNDGQLIDLFHGDDRTMWMGLGFSLCILLPSLFQLNMRMKKG